MPDSPPRPAPVVRLARAGLLGLAAVLAAPSLPAADPKLPVVARPAVAPRLATTLQPAAPISPRRISLVLRDADLNEAMAMIAKAEGVNILLAKGVEGEVNVNLRNVEMEEAIHAIAGAAGFAVEKRDGAYLVVKREEVNKYARSGLTQLRTFKIQYSSPEALEGIVKNHLSAYGKVTKLNDRKLLVVEDTPEFLERISGLLVELDRQPRQILIEAKILEVTLTDGESFGLDWKKMFQLGGDRFSLGVQGLNKPSAGLDFHLINPNNADLVLKALSERQRVRTLSTPKLLALEDQEAETIIGDRQGYKVTTTINQVTTESIQFLESGVILKVKPSVDARGHILLDIHPEVSNGKVTDGIPAQTTTEVTTHMLVEDGQTVFIGGLIKHELTESRDGVPVLGDIPLLGRLFSNDSSNVTKTETIVLITPRLVGEPDGLYGQDVRARTERDEREVLERVRASEAGIRLLLDRGASASVKDTLGE